MANLLFEIGCEELPPSLIENLTQQVLENIIKGLIDNNIYFNKEDIKTFNTPRRIAIYISEIPLEQNLESIEVKGPPFNNAFDKEGNPTQAAIGFAKKYNLEPKDLTKKKINNIDYLFATTTTGGRKTKDVLSEVLYHSIKNTTGDKYMKWGNNEEKFSRPIKWILSLLGNEIIDLTYTKIKSSNKSYGHRFFNKNNPIEFHNSSEYEKKLLEYKVIVSSEDRKHNIISQIEKVANSINTTPVINEDLLNEVTNITEYPSALLCSFDKDFLSLPSCIIETILRKHQKYFILKDKTGKLTNNFIVITNGTEILSNDREVKEQIKRGNEKVVKARLNDGKFFYNEDSKLPFTYETRGPQLSKITFQKGLGSMEEKVSRVIKLSEVIYETLQTTKTLTKDELITTAKLCKLDLTTHLVFELPELQGEVGAVLANINNFNNEISTGIKEHYYPRFQGDITPTTLSGYIVGITDKLDNITCLFTAGKRPTGSADPFALRRQAQGIVDNILNKQIFVDLLHLISESKKTLPNNIKERFTQQTVVLIKDFIMQRFTTIMENNGYESDLIHSVTSVGEPLEDLLSTYKKIDCLKRFNSEYKNTFNPFLIAAKRLVRIVENNGNGTLDISLLKTEQEKTLLQNIQKIESKTYKETHDFLIELSELTAPINNFFDKVLVNDPDPKVKQARQSLLKQGKILFERICDFNKIQDRS